MEGFCSNPDEMRMRGRENMVRWILEVELTKFAFGLGRGMKERESGMTLALLT